MGETEDVAPYILSEKGSGEAMSKKPQPQSNVYVDTLGLQLTFAKMLERVVEEVAKGIPSHAWSEMKQIREDAKQMRVELEALVERTQ